MAKPKSRPSRPGPVAGPNPMPDPTPGPPDPDAGPTPGPHPTPSTPPPTPPPTASPPPRPFPGDAAGAVREGFAPGLLDRSTIALPLLKLLEEEREDAARPARAPETTRLLGTMAGLDPAPPSPATTPTPGPAAPPRLHAVIIDLNLLYPVDGRKGAKERASKLVEEVVRRLGGEAQHGGVVEAKSRLTEQYLFCRLSAGAIRALVAADADPDEPGAPRPHRAAIHHVWPDFPIRGQIDRSIATVKADAAQRSYSALGEDIVWAVVDSGIDRGHPHFRQHGNLDLDPSIPPADFTAIGGAGDPFRDGLGHGTHVAGIIAGALTPEPAPAAPVLVSRRVRDSNGVVIADPRPLTAPIAGMAPRCKLLSLKVLDDDGGGEASNIIAAIAHIQEINGNGRRIRVHGVNLSVGYSFDPEWFACGQSPLCVEVNRLVRSGVVVVVAAGNSGYGSIIPFAETRVNRAGLDQTINDPGNADLAITVGSTHRDMPHVYGVSYFSSKGPTGDGRPKPDLVAPGENIVSCRSTHQAEPESPEAEAGSGPGELYAERSGTSQAAPHVSGVIAAFLSVRREFIGEPELVKRVFLASATDLNRVPSFQGKGLVDLMRAIQSV